MMAARDGGGENVELLFSGYRATVMPDEKVLEIHSTTMHI